MTDKKDRETRPVNLRKVVADIVLRAVEAEGQTLDATACFDVSKDARNPYAFVITMKDEASGESKQFRVVVKPLAVKDV